MAVVVVIAVIKLSSPVCNDCWLAGYTALHMAAAWNRVEIVKVLVESGADCDLKNSYNEVARDVAERYGNRNCMNFLDSSGVSALACIINCPQECCLCLSL